jgi:hypothetical protein
MLKLQFAKNFQVLFKTSIHSEYQNWHLLFQTPCGMTLIICIADTQGVPYLHQEAPSPHQRNW